MGFKIYLLLLILTISISTFLIIYQNTSEKIASLKPFELTEQGKKGTVSPSAAQVKVDSDSIEINKNAIQAIKSNDDKELKLTTITQYPKDDQNTLQTKSFDKHAEVQRNDSVNDTSSNSVEFKDSLRTFEPNQTATGPVDNPSNIENTNLAPNITKTSSNIEMNLPPWKCH